MFPVSLCASAVAHPVASRVPEDRSERASLGIPCPRLALGTALPPGESLDVLLDGDMAGAGGFSPCLQGLGLLLGSRSTAEVQSGHRSFWVLSRVEDKKRELRRGGKQSNFPKLSEQPWVINSWECSGRLGGVC